MIDDEINTHNAWETLKELKPRGSGLLNSTIKKFESITLAGCDHNAQTYTNLFKKVSREFRILSPDLVFNENWLIYHYYVGLGPTYSSYCEQYNQNHDPFTDDGKPKFKLDYAITRFMNTIANPAKNPVSSTESQAIAALVNGTFSHNTHSVIALIATGATEIKVQPRANAGNSRTFTQTCKYCTHCKKDWYCNSECTTLHPHLKKKNDGGNNSGNSRGRGRGRGGRGGRGGGRRGNSNNTSNDSKPATDTQAAVAVTESTAFSFMAYAEQPSAEATCLIANSQSLQNRTA